MPGGWPRGGGGAWALLESTDALLDSTLLLLRMVLMVMLMLYKYVGYRFPLILTYIYVCLSSLTIIVFNVIMPMSTYIHMTVANVKALF